MGHPAGKKIDRIELERRRMRGARLLEKGLSEAEVARRVGAHRQSVNRWAQKLRKGGRPALKRARRTGRPPKLSAGDLRRIKQALRRGPGTIDSKTGLRVGWRPADLIERECGVKFSAVHAWRVLRALGCTRQRLALEAALRRLEKRRWRSLLLRYSAIA